MTNLPRITLPPPYDAKEWMVTNGLGGYASGLVAGGVSRRHDGALVAALSHPHGRTVMVDWLEESLCLADGTLLPLCLCPMQFHLVGGLPQWEMQTPVGTVWRRVVMPWRQNSTHILYDMPAGCTATLHLRPWFHVRHGDWGVDQPQEPTQCWEENGGCVVQAGHWPPVRLFVEGGQWQLGGPLNRQHTYPVETERDFVDCGPLLSPCAVNLQGRTRWTVILSTEPWVTATAHQGDQAWQADLIRRQALLRGADPHVQDGMAAQMVMASDAFIFEPQNRPAFAAQAQAEGHLVRSIIAGYPWFNDWGRKRGPFCTPLPAA
jgi:hypothetical protein